MLKRKMSMAWERWQEVYQDLKFANRMGGGAIRRMLNRKLSMKRKMSMAWEKWQQVYQDLKFANRMGGGALNRKLSMAFEKWQFTFGVCSTGSFRWRGRSGSRPLQAAEMAYQQRPACL
eukprot:TRINITY_DN520_c0_g1_i3.p1 TRINITY_DN520_c0_g1~~TRINITY_DN520_c0_g1_i3.p1  ORF type:complete len:119 (-),score=25.93 TRINITY_DN520_c0_g1_i3:157-513(-)